MCLLWNVFCLLSKSPSYIYISFILHNLYHVVWFYFLCVLLLFVKAYIGTYKTGKWYIKKNTRSVISFLFSALRCFFSSFFFAFWKCVCIFYVRRMCVELLALKWVCIVYVTLFVCLYSWGIILFFLSLFVFFFW